MLGLQQYRKSKALKPQKSLRVQRVNHFPIPYSSN